MDQAHASPDLADYGEFGSVDRVKCGVITDDYVAAATSRQHSLLALKLLAGSGQLLPVFIADGGILHVEFRDFGSDHVGH